MMTPESAGVFAAVLMTLYIGHTFGDHWVQTDHQAATKATPGRVGWLADARHVIGLTATQGALLWLVGWFFGLELAAGWVLAGLAFNAVTHWIIDRRWPLRWLAELLPGKVRFLELGTPRAGHDDQPHLGTGAYALDQSLHVLLLLPAALVAVL